MFSILEFSMILRQERQDFERLEMKEVPPETIFPVRRRGGIQGQPTTDRTKIKEISKGLTRGDKYPIARTSILVYI
jgi:hypothetical protein